MENEQIAILISELCSLQDERAHTFRLFEEGHLIYMTTAPSYDLTKFQRLIVDVTKKFKRISGCVASIETKLRKDLNRPDLADIVKNLEEEERLKLQLTVNLQLSRQDPIDDGSTSSDIINKTNERLKFVTKSIEDLVDQLRYSVR